MKKLEKNQRIKMLKSKNAQIKMEKSINWKNTQKIKLAWHHKKVEEWQYSNERKTKN